MISDKKYYSISEVSEIISIKEHVIRHWDSVDPKTKKLRIEGLSIRTRGGTRFFNKNHIKKLTKLKNLLEDNGKRNYSLNLASKIISQSGFKNNFEKNYSEKSDSIPNEEYNRIKKVINNLKNLLNH